MVLVGWRGKNPIEIGWGIIRRLIKYRDFFKNLARKDRIKVIFKGKVNV